MKNLKNIGRIIYALPFIVFGSNHFIYAGYMQGLVPSFIPGGIFWIYLTGTALIAASISILIKKYIVLSSLLLAFMLFIFIITIHIPGLSNQQTAQLSLMSLMKDASLMGAAIFIAGIYKEK
jgi:uncharacterized membrane protein